MKLLIQIPCHNESKTLPQVLSSIPRSIAGISKIEVLVIDDGSTDNTSQIAKQHGADRVLRNTANLGLAFSFRNGLDTCLSLGADIIVNMDGDNQYRGEEIPLLIQPILEGSADIVVGDRRTDLIEEFSLLKRWLQKLGSATIRHLSQTKVRDAVSGFRAFSKDAAIKLTILSHYTYTLESILQAQSKGLTIANIPISTNPKTRESRLMKSIRSYLAFSIATIIRVFTMYNPLRVFLYVGGWFIFLGVLLSIRFLYFYLTMGGTGKLQSLILAAICLIVGATISLVGLLADLIQFNRRLLEDILVRIKKQEFSSITKASDQTK